MYVAYYPKQLKKNYSLGVRIVCRDLRPAEANFYARQIFVPPHVIQSTTLSWLHNFNVKIL